MKKLVSVLCTLIILGFVMPAYVQHHDPAPPANGGQRVPLMTQRLGLWNSAYS